MHFLVIDARFGTPIYVLLETDPRSDGGFPALAVREITLELQVEATDAPGAHVGRPVTALGRDPAHLDRFREFGSDRAVARAGFILIEPLYVGPSWPSYLSAFRPEGAKQLKHPRHVAGARRPVTGA